jgi:hypothetical protein
MKGPTQVGLLGMVKKPTKEQRKNLQSKTFLTRDGNYTLSIYVCMVHGVRVYGA